MSEALVIERNDGPPTVLALSGELDAGTAPNLDAALSSVDAGEAIVVDVSRLGFIDSSGLRIIIAADRRHREAGGSLTLQAPSERVRRILEVTGLDEVLQVG